LHLPSRRVSRASTLVKRLSWLAVPVIAFAGLVYPWLGLGVLVIMAALVISALFRGKAWCGQVCPHGSLFDVLLVRFSPNRNIPRFLSSPAFRWGFFAWFMAMLGWRLYGVFRPGLDWGLWERLGRAFVIQYLVFPTAVGTLLALTLNSRAWCAFCPMGTMQEVLYRLGLRLGLNRRTDRRLSWRAGGACSRCGLCGRVCPIGLQPYRGLDSGEGTLHEQCLRCWTCVRSCPSQALEANLGPGPLSEGTSSRKGRPPVLDSGGIGRDP